MLDFLNLTSPLDISNTVRPHYSPPGLHSTNTTSSSESLGNTQTDISTNPESPQPGHRNIYRQLSDEERREIIKAYVPSPPADTACLTALDNKTAKDGGSRDSRAIQDIASQDLLLPALLEYNKTFLDHVFRTTLYTCQVCFREKLGQLCLQFVGCGHVYCKECMQGYFKVQIDDGSVSCLTCPSENCESQATPSQVKM